MADQPVQLGDGLADVLARASAAMAERWRGVDVAAETRAREEAERRQRVADREALLRSRGVPASPARLIAADQLADTKSLRAAQRWLRAVLAERTGAPRAPRILVLAGQKDAAKTTAAGWLVDKWPWQRSEQLPLLVAVEDLLGPWFAVKNDDPPDAITRLRRRDLLATSLLVLDDVGQEASNERVATPTSEAIDVLLRRRCDDGTFTCITTNELTAADLCARYSARPRIAERLTEFGKWVDCPREGFRDEDRRAAVLEQRRQQQKARTT